MTKLSFRKPDSGQSGGKLKNGWLVGGNIASYVLMCVMLGLVSIVLSVGSYNVYISLEIMKEPELLAYNLLPVIALGLVFYGLVGRSWLSYLLTGAVVLGLSAGNYYKIALRDDPLMLGDLLLIREAGNMLGRYDLFLSKTIVCTILCFLAGFLCVFLFRRGKPRWWLRVGSLCCGILIGLCVVPRLLTSNYENEIFYDHIEQRYSSTQQYIAHGFVYPFIYSYRSTVDKPPEGYDEAQVAELMEGYTDADIPDEEKVNIIGIMLEAYNDFSRYETVELQTDVYRVWHRLQEEGCSGRLVSNVFAAGTIDPERSFLTGQSQLRSYRVNTNSYLWYFQSQGYYVDGMHPSENWFYNRRNINENIGFNDYGFLEDYYAERTSEVPVPDDFFFADLIEHYKEHTAGDVPYFNFSVTFQGHGPYRADTGIWKPSGSYLVYDDRYNNIYQYNTVENYFGSIENTNQNLELLTDYLREDPEPVVLVLFGDHNPYLGENNLVYEYLGINLDNDTEEGFLNYYSTEYLIWANDAAREVLGDNFKGEGPTISPCFLMHQVFKLCGWEGPAFMQATQTVFETIPVVHAQKRYLYNHEIVNELPEEQARIVADYKNIQYYWRTNFVYGKD